MEDCIHLIGTWFVLAAALFPWLLALVPTSVLERFPHTTAKLGIWLAVFSLGCAVGAVVVLILKGPVHSVLWQWGYLRLEVYFDTLSAVLLILVSVLSVVIHRYAGSYMEGDSRQGSFTRWLSLTAGSVLVLVVSSNLLFFAAAWASVSVCLHRLLVFYPDRPGARLAARKKFIFSRLADLCLLGAIVLIHSRFGTLSFPELFQRAGDAAGRGEDGFAGIGFLLVLCALLKSAQFPFHSWLPDTMETPTPVSALMHAGIINAGGFLIVRLSPVVVLSSEAMLLLAAVGGFTALFASLTMLTHASVKRALAFSTVAQMGFMMLECGLGAFSLAVLHLVAHSLYKAHAFLSSGSIPQLSRAAWVPDERVKSHPLVFVASLLVSGLLCFGAARLLGVQVLKNPGAFFLILVLGFSVAYMLWNLWSHTPDTVLWLGGVGMAAAVALGGMTLHRLMDALLAGIVPVEKSGWTPLEIGLAGFPLGLFLGVLVFQTQLPAWSGQTWCRAFYVHARNGFYFTTLANRLVAALWPIPPGRSGLNSPSEKS